MGIVPEFGEGAITQRVQSFQKRLEKAVVYTLKYLGEELTRYAREKHNYTDQTGNLTNSIGYAVVLNSSIVYNGVDSQPNEGTEAALKVAMKMAAHLPNSYSLIVVAGMNYAAYVEAKGYNVILPAEIKARHDFPQRMQSLAAKARGKAQELFGTQ